MPFDPNHYDLSGNGVFVSYSTTSNTGVPVFSYQDDFRVLNFSGDQIEIDEASPLGLIVSVAIFRTVDSGGAAFSLLVPQVALPSEAATVRVHTYGITAFQRFSIFPQPPLFAQRTSYGVTELSGTASILKF
jgi:hypothetical protein